MIASARNQIKILEKKIYLDNASAGPLPEPTRKAIIRFVDMWSDEGEPWEDGWIAVYEAKKLFGELVGASTEEIAAFPGITYALSVILSSLKLRRECVAVASSLNFPTSITVLKSMLRRGLIREVRIVKSTRGFIELSEYERIVDESVCIVVADYVGWLSGHVEDLRELANIAHEKGAILISDAFHAVGVMPINVKQLGVDVLLTGSYKWLMAPHGAALGYVSRNLVAELDPPYAGWIALDDSVVARMLRGEPEFERPIDVEKPELARDARRLEWGTLPLLSFYALRESLKFLKEHNAVELFESHTRKLAEIVMNEVENLGLELLTPRDRHAAIVTFKYKKPRELVKQLRKRRVVVSARPGLVRVSPHFYNNKDDIELFIEALKESIKAI